MALAIAAVLHATSSVGAEADAGAGAPVVAFNAALDCDEPAGAASAQIMLAGACERESDQCLEGCRYDYQVGNVAIGVAWWCVKPWCDPENLRAMNNTNYQACKDECWRHYSECRKGEYEAQDNWEQSQDGVEKYTPLQRVTYPL